MLCTPLEPMEAANNLMNGAAGNINIFLRRIVKSKLNSNILTHRPRLLKMSTNTTEL